MHIYKILNDGTLIDEKGDAFNNFQRPLYNIYTDNEVLYTGEPLTAIMYPRGPNNNVPTKRVWEFYDSTTSVILYNVINMDILDGPYPAFTDSRWTLSSLY